MTTSAHCSYGPDREHAMLEYLYGEHDGAGPSEFASHVTQCPVCRTEVGSLRDVRQALAGWAPPEPMRALGHRASIGDRPRPLPAPADVRPTPSWAVPAWARAAAAVLCVGVGLGAANLQVAYSQEGLSIRTGWWAPSAPATATAAGVTAVGVPGAPAVGGGTEVPAAWQAQLTALEQSLRSDMEALRTAAVSHVTPATDDAVLRQVRTLIARSEQRQQSELALRIGDVLNDVQTQRRADLSRIERTIGVVQNSTGMEVMRQREMINTLAVRVSSQR